MSDDTALALVVIICFVIYINLTPEHTFDDTKALGKWKVTFINAQFLAEQCDEIIYEIVTESDIEKWGDVYKTLDWEKTKLKFIQGGDSAFLLETVDGPGVFAAVPAIEEPVFEEQDLLVYRYRQVGNYMVVTGRHDSMTILLSKSLVDLSDVTKLVSKVGLGPVQNITGCVKDDVYLYKTEL